MKTLIKSIFIFICTYNVSVAFDVPLACLEKSRPHNDCVNCVGKEITNKPSALSQVTEVFSTYLFVESRVKKLATTNKTIKRSMVPLFRSLRDGPQEPAYKEYSSEIKAIRADYDRLTLLSKESIILENKIKTCTKNGVMNCTAYRLLQFRDSLESVQKSKIALLLKRPFFLHSKIEERMQNLSDELINTDKLLGPKEFQDDMVVSMMNKFDLISDQNNKYINYENDEGSPKVRSAANISGPVYLKNVVNKYPLLIEELITSAVEDRSINNEQVRKPVCELAFQLKKQHKSDFAKDVAIEVGLTLLPLATGPFAPEAIVGIRLLRYGLKSKEIAKTIKITSLISQGSLAALNTKQMLDLSNRCKATEVKFLTSNSEAALNNLKKCEVELGEEIFLSSVQLLATTGASVSSITLKMLSKAKSVPVQIGKNVNQSHEVTNYLNAKGLTELKPGQASIEFHTPDKGVFTVIDVSKLLSAGNSPLKGFPEDYWRYVGNIYNDRLDLSPQEIEKMVKTSLDLGSRTKIITNTDISPIQGQRKIRGGIGIVESKNADELLPTEMANNIRIQRKPNEKIIEFVRLTAGKDSGAAELADDLVDQAANLASADKSVSRVVIYTSKIHARMYKKMGVPVENTLELNKRDVQIEITREGLEKFIKMRAGKRSTISSFFLEVDDFTLNVFNLLPDFYALSS